LRKQKLLKEELMKLERQAKKRLRGIEINFAEN
jgi:hypothetical protein